MTRKSPGTLYAALRIFDVSLSEMLWSRRTIFMGLVVGLPVVLAMVVRLVTSLGAPGMRQRVKLAQALVHDPELLILDEPLAGMDPIARRKTIRMIRDWAKQGKSILVSSHILHEIESMTSNILLINQGRILAEGNVHQIRDLIDEHPHTVYIKADETRALARQDRKSVV